MAEDIAIQTSLTANATSAYTNDELAVRLYEPAKMLLRTVEGLQRLMVVRKKARDKYVTAASVAAKRKTTLDAVRAKPDASEASKQSAQTANDNAEREAKDAKDALDRCPHHPNCKQN